MIADRVKETTTTTGTGTVTLAGAATAFQTFVAGIGDGNACYYCIQSLGSGEWEVGIGTVTDASPDTLSRTTVLQSSNADALVDFSAGTKDVFIPLPAGKALYRDADGDMPDAESWDGSQTFNAGIAIASGQSVEMANDTWIGAGAGKVNILFDDSNNVIDVRNGPLRLIADEQLLQFGAAQDLSIQWDGNDAVFTVTAGQFRFVGGNVELEDTTDANAGVITKGADRFIHNFHHPTGGGAVPVGQNTFIGVGAGNFTMGSGATQIYHASKNVGLGAFALDALSIGYQNLAIGYANLGACTSGANNVGVGVTCLGSITTTGGNVAIGVGTLNNCIGSNNVAIGYLAALGLTSGGSGVSLGYQAGRFIADGSTPNETSNNSIYVGSETRASADGADNEIVIGLNAIGKGANTAVIGGSTLTKVYLPALSLLERSADPTEPAEGECVIWMSDGTGKGDDGDVLIASKAGGATKWATLFDHSGGAGW